MVRFVIYPVVPMLIYKLKSHTNTTTTHTPHTHTHTHTQTQRTHLYSVMPDSTIGRENKGKTA